jgi:FkbM family methyltransferase
MKYSIVIPTYNHCKDFLKPCIESLIKYSTLADLEIIVVANGCTDGTADYLAALEAVYGKTIHAINITDKLGYPKAVNAGIRAASGEYIVLLNNDTVLLEQPTNQWLDMLVAPFTKSKSVGITGPVKFDWDCAGRTLQAMAFWLVMIPRSVFNKVGMLDEIFTPGMGEDGDFCIRATQAGYSMVSVPNDVTGHFDTGIVNQAFPIFHVGNGTFQDPSEDKVATIERNNAVLHERYGKKKDVLVSIVVPTYNHLHDALRPCLSALYSGTDFTDKELIVVANGCTDDTSDFLHELAQRDRRTNEVPTLQVIWIDEPVGYIRAVNAGINLAQGKYIVLLDNDSILQEQSPDYWIRLLLTPFLQDSTVGASSPFANEYEGLDGLVLHSGCTMYDAKLLKDVGAFDEVYNPGYMSDSDVSMKIWRAGRKCAEVPEPNPDKAYKNGVFAINFPVVHTGEVQTMNKAADIEIIKKNHALFYSRYGKTDPQPMQQTRPKYSIVIPTYNHCDDLLVPCVNSILAYSNMDETEIIIVANGCTDGTRDYVNALTQTSQRIRLIWEDEALGYTKATNLGIKAATGEFVVLLNNDTVLLEQPTNMWLDWLASAFKDTKVGMAGPLSLFDNYSNHEVLIFFCVMIHSTMFQTVGLLDEVYTPGGGEDIDFTIRLKRAGYKAVEITPKSYTPEAGTNVGGFPIWHRDNKTFGEIPEYTNVIVKRNGLLNCLRYNDEIRLNLGAGGIDYPGFLSLDKYDKRSNIPMDITSLSGFPDSSVTELMASHVFEHLNPYHSVPILHEWLRVLKPGGKLAMEMPDIEALCKSFLAETDYYKKMGILNAVYGSVNTTDVGGPDEITSPHLFGWWPESLHRHLAQAGYVDISFHPERWPHPCDNLRVEAYKPALTVNRQSLAEQEPATYEEIFVTNSYGLVKEDVRGKTVIDIGANLGMFSLACLEHGATRIISVEAQPTIFKLGLLYNVAQYHKYITPVNYAAHSTDGQTVKIINHHVGSKVGNEGDDVNTISLTTLLTEQNVLGNDLVMKIDCEGSEFDVLLSTTPEVLRRFGVIYMEVHDNTNVNPAYHDSQLISRYLIASGFSQVKHFPYYAFSDTGEQVWIGVAVQKWVRNA